MKSEVVSGDAGEHGGEIELTDSQDVQLDVYPIADGRVMQVRTLANGQESCRPARVEP